MKLAKYQEGLNALCFMDLLSLKNPSLCAKLSQSKNYNISCIEDKNLKANFYKCEIASVSFVLALLCKMSIENEFNELDEGYLSAESCFGEEEALEILDFLKEAKCIIFDENLYQHKDFENIKYFLEKLCHKFNLLLICSNENEENLQIQKSFTELLELDNFDGTIIMQTPLKDKELHCSPSFALIAKVKDEDKIILKINAQEFTTMVKINHDLKGMVALFNYKSTDFAFSKAQVKVIK
ncbi:hypothetical protein [Campylobacter subantarcticus]|uniref:NADH dehydrogenase I subunit F n=1 Tax=Campylobacter subantarcticus LMG 24374 TaxID=1388751 RepID=A0A0A8HBF8_9BACT|nr:hypothetical protein [Campylobacter subantarcticus]AJC91448.1 hypothetical protein CSUB8521_1631 [Campylobacter subantarcticus LMG 24374]EAJ1260958.1 hypothetical protein [Campylobacter lari]EAJ1262130.1 hypothetical protein [Campylobacter lari]